MKKPILVSVIILAAILIWAFIQRGPATDEKTQTSQSNNQINIEEVYYDSVESALNNADFHMEEGEEFQNTITHEIHRFENEDYLTLDYLSLKDDSEGCLMLAKFKKKHDGKEDKYICVGKKPLMVGRDSFKVIDGLELVKMNLEQMPLYQIVNIDPDNTLFMCGNNGDKNIYNLKIDGQAPDGVVPYNLFGEERYFWYYEDLTTKNPVDEMVVTMDE